MTAEGRRVHERAQATIGVIESVLLERIGADAARALDGALRSDWGVPPLVAAP
jgi:hypothetical protein